MIPATSIAFQDDGTAWLVRPGDNASREAWTHEDRPCDECGGTGHVSDHSDGCDRACGGKCGGTGIKRCDCINGRHTFPLVVAGEWGDPPKPHQVLRVSVVPDTILPIVDSPGPAGPIPAQACIEIVSESYARQWYWSEQWGEWHHRQIILPSDAKPGGFAVLVRWEADRAVRATS